MTLLDLTLLSSVFVAVCSGQSANPSTTPTSPGGSDPDPEECGRAPPALREALLYTVTRHDSNDDGIIDPTDLEWENIIYSSGEGTDFCGEEEIRQGCPVICVTTPNEWTTAWQCLYGFDRGYAQDVFNYLDINQLPGYPRINEGDGAMLNRDLKDRLIPMAPVTAIEWRHILADLFREYCRKTSSGKYCDQIATIADF